MGDMSAMLIYMAFGMLLWASGACECVVSFARPTPYHDRCTLRKHALEQELLESTKLAIEVVHSSKL